MLLKILLYVKNDKKNTPSNGGTEEQIDRRTEGRRDARTDGRYER